MRSILTVLIALSVACSQAQPAKESAVAAETVQDTTKPTDCASPQVVALPQMSLIDAKAIEETKSRFFAAFGRACVKGLLESKELIDPKAADPAHLFLLNAPDANVASLYLSKSAGNHMVLEYPFQAPDGKTRVPSAAELDEAIYCTMVGATAKEQEESGRCLAD